MKNLDRISELSSHIRECVDLLGDKVSDANMFDDGKIDDREFVRDLIHTISTDANRMMLAFNVSSPNSPWDTSPHYLEVESRHLTPEESAEQGLPEQWGNRTVHSRRTGLGDSPSEVTPLFGKDGKP